MGFLDKLGLTGTGVHVTLQAPESVDPAQAGFQAIVGLSADEPKTILGVRVSLYRQERTTDAEGMPSENDEEILWQENNQQFVLQPGQPISMPFDIPVAGPGLAALAARGGVVGRVASMMQQVQELESRQYKLHVSVRVDGTHMRGHASQWFWVGRPGGWL